MMKRPWHRDRWYFVLPFLVLAYGTVGYRLIEGWSWLDCFYMTTITITTVGFQEVATMGSPGRLFTTLLILFGVGSFSVVLSTMFQWILIQHKFEERIIRKRARKMKDHFLICGAGRVGLEVANMLMESRKDFLVIEKDHAVIEELRKQNIPCLEGDATDEEVMAQARLDTARGLACVLDSDADNVFSTLIARELNPNIFIVARATNDSSISKLLKAGANKVFNPFVTTANRVKNTLLRPSVVDFLEIASSDKVLDLAIEEVFVPEHSSLVGLKLSDSQLRQRENVVAVAIQKKGGRMVFNPSSAETILAGDVLIVIGSRESLMALTKRVQQKG